MKQLFVVSAWVIGLTFSFSSNCLGQWIPASGVPGGIVGSVAMNGSTIIACAWSKGVFLSTNDGTSWSPVTGLAPYTVSAMRSSGNNFFAVTDSGLFISTDTGTTWRADTVGLPPGGTRDFIEGGSTLYTLIDGWSIYASTDHGLSWSFLDSSIVEYNARIAASDRKLFAMGWNPDQGLYTILLSIDRGKHWTMEDTAFQYSDPTRGVAPTLTVSGDYLFSQNLPDGIVRSSDNGATWIPVNTGLPIPEIGPLAISGTTLFDATHQGVFRSTNNGDSWTPVNSGLGDTNIQALGVSGGIVTAATDGGLFISSNNGDVWQGINVGLANPSVLAFGGSESTMLAGTDRGIWKSTNRGASWNVSNTTGINTYSRVNSFTTYGTTLFGTTGWAGQVIRSTDNGASWKNVFNHEIYNISALAVIGPDVFAGTQLGVFRSPDTGTTWLQDDMRFTYFIQVLAVQGTNLVAGTDRNGIFLSKDLGKSWDTVNSGLTNLQIHALTVNGENIFAGTDGGVFLTTNNGVSWTAVNSGLMDTTVNAFAWSGKNLFAGTGHSGIFLSTNDGASWHSVNDALPGGGVGALTVSGSNLIAGTAGAGIWSRPLAEMISTNAVAPARSTHGSIVAYPNPLTQSTTISLTSSESGAARVTIVNMLGEEIARVFDGELPDVGNGECHFTWDARGFMPGTYWCELRMNGRVERTAIVLERQ